ncbi:MAG: PmoA family protein, partial [Thermoguttaceae bacterium]|nr:PmoA family protein [Thermoguttaceae bacterium]
MKCCFCWNMLFAAMVSLTLAASVHATDPALPDAKPVPDMQVTPLPYDQAAFEHLGRELTRYHFGENLRRPFWFPVVGPGGRSLTRMGMPGDPARSVTQASQPEDPNRPASPGGHSHQNSV